MAQKPADDEGPVKNLVNLFLSARDDERTVTEVEQRLELHVVGTTAYIPSYTRSVMDKKHGSPVMAIHTRTVPESKVVFIYPAEDPDASGARRLRSADTMGPAYVAFAVPLRKIKVRLSVKRRVILTLHRLEVPKQGTVYWASFADIEKERREIGGVAAAKQGTPANTRARNARRSRKIAPDTTPG